MTHNLAPLTRAVMNRKGTKEGAEIKFLCPAHDDTKPSARYNPTKGVWHCFTCCEGGGYVDLARRLGIDLDPLRSSRKRRRSLWR